MDYPSNLQKGIIIKRLNRFVIKAEIAGEETLAHLPSSGRMADLLVRGRTAWFLPAPGAHRKTSHKIVLVENSEGNLVSVDATLPNRLFREAFDSGRLKEFSHYRTIQSEVTRGNSRFDFFLTNEDTRCYVEVKSVTHVDNGTARFPDAPTERGRKHVQELSELALEDGTECAVVFIVQREDAERFEPYRQIDPEFAEKLEKAKECGVSVFAYGCTICLDRVEIAERIPVFSNSAL